MFYNLRTVLWKGRLHQLMILYFLLKLHFFTYLYLLATFVMFSDMLSNESHIFIYIIDILKIGDTLYIEK